MMPRRLVGSMVVASALAVLSGCVSASAAGDLRRVRELSGIASVPALPATVDPAPSADALELLRRPLDAESAVRVALLNNRELRASLRELGIARGAWTQAALPPNPVVELELQPERNSNAELRVEYDLTSTVLASLRAGAAESTWEAERTRVAAQVLDLGYRTRTAFLDAQVAERRLAVAQQVLDGVVAAREASQAMHAAGNVADLDRALQESTYQKGRLIVARLEFDVARTREKLNRLLGLHGDATRWTLRPSLDPTPEHHPLEDAAIDVEKKAIESSLELASIRHRLESLAKQTGASRAAGWLPDVSVDVHSLIGAPETATAAADKERRFGGGFTVGVPLFDRKQGQTEALEAQFDALLEQYHGLAIDLRSGAREARNRLVSAHARARHLQDVVIPAQQRVADEMLLQYNAMQVGIFQLLQSRRDALEVQLEALDAQRDYWAAVAGWEALRSGTHVATSDSSPLSTSPGLSAPAAGGGH